VGSDWIYRRQYQPLAEMIEELFAVTRNDVIELARRLDLTSYTLVALGPAKDV